MKKYLSFLFLIWTMNLEAQNIEVSSIDSLFSFVEKRSAVIKVGQQQSLLAKWTKITALGNTINLKSPISAAWTDNTQLPISYLPAEAFGGKPGSFREIQIGQQYVSTYNISPQIDIINPSAWMRVKSAEINQKLTETNNRLAQKNLYESIAAAYFNIVSLQSQIVQLKRNLASADSVESLVKNKFETGIVREQDLNNAQINSLLLTDKMNQTSINLEQNYNNIKILCDLHTNERILISEKKMEPEVLPSEKAQKSNLLNEQNQLQVAFNQNELKSTRWQSFSPTVSLIFNQSWQQNSNEGFFNANSFNFNSQYIGLKLSVPFPLDATRLSQNFTSKITHQISQINAQHAMIQNDMNTNQLNLDYEKSLTSFEISKKVLALKTINFQKSQNQFTEGILSTELLLGAFTDLVNAEITYNSTKSALLYASTKITINNSFQ